MKSETLVLRLVHESHGECSRIRLLDPVIQLEKKKV